MGISVETLAVAKKYTNRSIEGITGALAGKNATIESITDITGGHRVTFKWTADNGDVRTQTMDVMDGAKGDTGAQGPKGDVGATGAQGIQGVKGDTGAQGPKGDKGDTGATGAKGDQGIQGIKGDKGDDGYPFLIYKQYDDISEFSASDFPEIGLMFMIMDFIPDTGYPIYRYTGTGTPPYSLVTYMNTEGIKGDKGDKGDQGEQGIQGPKGDKGDKGDQGDQGIQGIQGEQGEQGPTGATGAKGDKGDKGDAGEGVPEGGTAGQVLKKKSNTDYDTEWGEAASPLTFDTDDFDVSEENEVSLDVKQRIFTGTQAEWDALSTAIKKTYGVVNITDDESASESIKDITNLLVKEEGYVSGDVYVKKLGHVVQLDFHSLVVSDYDLQIMSGFPKPIDRTNTFVLQGDGNPQTIGLAQIFSGGILTSGPEIAGLTPGKLWDGTVMYLTND